MHYHDGSHRDISKEELARYSRQISLPQIGLGGQERLRAAKALVIGMGGLGSPAAYYLAAAGVGVLGLADRDQVEIHNLHRQILHETTSIGRPKVESALDRLEALNPDVHFHLHPDGVTVENALDLFDFYDVIVDCSDNFPTRYLVNDACVLAHKPLVYGSIFQFEGQVSVFNSTAKAPCYRCLFPQMPEPGTVPNCAEAGVIGALCGTIGSLQALETIKLLTGSGETLSGRLLVVEGLGMNFRTVKLKKDPACPICGEHPTISRLDQDNYQFTCNPSDFMSTTADQNFPLEISVDEAATWLRGGLSESVLLLDVREAHELAICQIDGATHLPLRQIPTMWNDLPKDKAIIVLCHHGMRSLRATEFLREQGLERVTSMAGGINAWAEAIEPSLQRY